MGHRREPITSACRASTEVRGRSPPRRRCRARPAVPAPLRGAAPCWTAAGAARCTAPSASPAAFPDARPSRPSAGSASRTSGRLSARATRGDRASTRRPPGGASASASCGSTLAARAARRPRRSITSCLGAGAGRTSRRTCKRSASAATQRRRRPTGTALGAGVRRARASGQRPAHRACPGLPSAKGDCRRECGNGSRAAAVLARPRPTRPPRAPAASRPAAASQC